MSHSTLLGSTKTTSKSKKRPKSSVGGNSPSSPPEETPQTLRRKTSAKKIPVFQEPSPPHSVTFSPPAKARPSLPTSPTHIAAMWTATQQKHPSMHFTEQPQHYTEQPQHYAEQPPQQQCYYHFLTPPSEPSERTSFPTPSPEWSPYYWSSSSPHSNSDWSEGILSPNSSSQGNNNKQSEAIFI